MLTTRKHFKFGTLAVALSTLCSVSSFQVYANQDLVIATLMKDYPNAIIEEITTIKEAGETLYEVDFEHAGNSYEAVYTAQGQLRNVQAEDFSDSTFILGLFVHSENNQYIGGKRETNMYPFLWYENGNFYIHGKSLGYRFYRSSGLSISTQLDIGIGDGYEPDENIMVADLPELDTPINLGVVLEKSLGNYELESVVQYDVADAHGGLTASLGFGREFRINDNWDMEIGAEIAYLDKNYTEYYFGVAPEYATVTRPEYAPKGTINYGLELSFRGRFADNWHLITGVEWMQLGSEIKDSPLADASSEVEISLGIGYAF